MKSLSDRAALLAVLALALLGAWACENRLPADRSYPYNPPDYTTIINFESGDNVNPTLLGATPGGVSKILWGGGGLNLTGIVTAPHPALILPVPGTMPNGSPTAVHVVESFTDKGNSEYPSNQLRIKPAGLGYYDLSPFSGIKFMLNIQAADDALKRRFAFGTAQTLPFDDSDSGGACDNSNNGCNNNFGAMLDNTNGVWVTKSYLFSELTRESFGNATTPSTFSGINLKQVIRIVWEEGRNNSPGVCTVDYWVDEVEFF
jgi:hypothetical protein